MVSCVDDKHLWSDIVKEGYGMLHEYNWYIKLSVVTKLSVFNLGIIELHWKGRDYVFPLLL